MKPNSFSALLFCASTAALISTSLFAEPTNDIAEAQAELNKQVLAKPFSPEEYQSVEIYIQEHHSRDIQPIPRWDIAVNCELLINIQDYRDCRYYKYYYAR